MATDLIVCVLCNSVARAYTIGQYFSPGTRRCACVVYLASSPGPILIKLAGHCPPNFNIKIGRGDEASYYHEKIVPEFVRTLPI